MNEIATSMSDIRPMTDKQKAKNHTTFITQTIYQLKNKY